MANNPMRGIRLGVACALGTLYASCWWAGVRCQGPLWSVPLIVVAVFSSVIIGVAIYYFLKEHWNG